MSFDKPFTYNPQTKKWSLELPKTKDDHLSQCGMKITFDPGIPCAGTAPFYQTTEPSAMKGATVEIRVYDNLMGWTSAVLFDFNALVEKLVELMPEGKVITDTFLLAQRDLAFKRAKEEEAERLAKAEEEKKKAEETTKPKRGRKKSTTKKSNKKK